jgi:hypothetical protein
VQKKKNNNNNNNNNKTKKKKNEKLIKFSRCLFFQNSCVPLEQIVIGKISIIILIIRKINTIKSRKELNEKSC